MSLLASGVCWKLSLQAGVGSWSQDGIRDDAESQVVAHNSDCRGRRVDYVGAFACIGQAKVHSWGAEGTVIEIVAVMLRKFAESSSELLEEAT